MTALRTRSRPGSTTRFTHTAATGNTSWLTRGSCFPRGARRGSRARQGHHLRGSRGSTETASYRLHGRGVVADLHMAGDRLRSAGCDALAADDRQRALTLVYTKVEFTDATVAGERRASMRPLLDKLAAGQGFLAMWQEYNRIEAQYLRRLVRRTGKVRYDAWERLADGYHPVQHPHRADCSR